MQGNIIKLLRNVSKNECYIGWDKEEKEDSYCVISVNVKSCSEECVNKIKQRIDLGANNIKRGLATVRVANEIDGYVRAINDFTKERPKIHKIKY